MSSSWALFDEHQRRNTLIMPCDDGTFDRKFEIYSSSELTGSVVLPDSRNIVSLSNLGNFKSNYDSKLIFVDEGWKYYQSEKLNPQSTAPLAVVGVPAQSLPAVNTNPSTIPALRFFDPDSYGLIADSEKSSNMVVIFSIPTLFYGHRLRPGTIKLQSNLYQGGGSVSGTDFVKGSDFRMPITLCDDTSGNIIVCNTSGSVATSNYVGSVYYEDGIIALKSPHLFNFGQNDFTMEFEGVHNTHMLELTVPIARKMFNSSSNPNYNEFKPSNDNNEDADSFVYISTLNFHDNNLNVIAKARLAQPIMKRVKDKYMIRVKLDF